MLWCSPAFLSRKFFISSPTTKVPLVFLPTSTSWQRLVSRFLFSPFLFVMIGESTHCCCCCFDGFRSTFVFTLPDEPLEGRSLFLCKIHLSEREESMQSREDCSWPSFRFLYYLDGASWFGLKVTDSTVHNPNCPYQCYRQLAFPCVSVPALFVTV